MKVTLRKQEEKQGTRWVVDYKPHDGNRTRRFFKSKNEADAFAAEKRLEQKRAGESFIALSTAERLDLVTGYARLQKLDLTLNGLLDQWENGSFRNGNGTHKTVSLRVAADAWIENLEAANRRERHIKNCRAWVNRFIKGREEMPVDKITLEDVKAWLAPFKKVTFNSYRDLVRAFFNFCHQHKYIGEMFCDSARLPKLHIDFESPVILTVEQTQSALEWICANQPDLLAYFTCATFCGIRPEEVDRMDWSMVDLEHGLIHLPAKITKVRRPRLIHLHATAKAWLLLAAKQLCPLGNELASRSVKMRGLRDHLGFDEWPHDVLRHSFGSYYVELTQDLAATALEMGNSPEIILRNYRSIVKPAQCKAFWALTPENLNS